MTSNMQFYPIGERAIVVKFGSELNENTYEAVTSLSKSLKQKPIRGTIEIVPTFTTVTIYYDPIAVLNSNQLKTKGNLNNQLTRSPYKIMHSILQERISNMEARPLAEYRTIKIPVCYEGDFAPDLDYVAAHNKLKKEKVIQIHTEGDYLVYMLGFAPGFPYMGGMSSEIATPRRKKPRSLVSSGSVGIAGEQTGIYSIDSPGGWQIIGRTPFKLFKPKEEQPTLFQAGDRIQFYPISLEEYAEIEEKQK
ncbi:5-oxoprolinase subunit PxpB [Chengkuizengella axinellae]|uniref:5-oxoprolinase subunit PxpB n=1 Tax=Chengkuizengella axinellae TaxID=3064388 RepID=A0ABT9J6N2_9BACL|nr:5-oxoprolinase subunit PxpB [Chengkuizengella sp. 2205SS18-9]MDP5276614.1 5-oxoprolinase subunit PxpB [Chengkuizengella sp. 2205SS18-9]